MKVVILAAGKGTRLKPLTDKIPKPLIKINNKSIIENIIEELPESITEIIIVVDYLKDKIKDKLGNKYKNLNIVYKNQSKKIRGTYGAIYSARLLLGKNERFLVLNGDDLHKKNDIEKFLKSDLIFGVYKAKKDGYRNIEINKKKEVISFSNKNNPFYIATGLYVLNSDFFKLVPKKLLNSDEYAIPHTLIEYSSTYKIKAGIATSWFSINNHEELREIRNIFKKQK